MPTSALPANPDEQALPESLSVKYFYTDTRICLPGVWGKFSCGPRRSKKRYFEDQRATSSHKPVGARRINRIEWPARSP